MASLRGSLACVAIEDAKHRRAPAVQVSTGKVGIFLLWAAPLGGRYRPVKGGGGTAACRSVHLESTLQLDMLFTLRRVMLPSSGRAGRRRRHRKGMYLGSRRERRN